MNKLFDFIERIKGKKYCRLPWCFKPREENGLKINEFYLSMGYCRYHSEIAKQVVKEINTK